MRHMKKITSVTTVFVGLVLFLMPFVGYAETVVRTGDTVSISDDQTIENDFYASGGIVSMSGFVRGDMYAIGGGVTINGDIAEDLALLAGTAQIHASVTDDVRIVGGDITIAEHVGGDLFVIGGVLTVLPTATIEGDVFFFGGEATVDGTVGGSVMGMMEKLRLNGTVAQNVDVTTASAVTLGDRASVGGSVTYVSQEELVRSSQAVIEGEIVRNSGEQQFDSKALLRDAATFIIVWLFSTLVLYLLLRERFAQIFAESIDAPMKATLIGLVFVFLAPAVVALLFVTMLGLLVGILSFWFYFGLILFAFTASGIVAGAFLARFAGKRAPLTVWWVIAGALSVIFVLAIPIIGQLCFLLLLCFTIGTVLLHGYRYLAG